MSDSDITNYAYVWYTTDSSELTDEQLNKIYEIMLTYSYPCYLSGNEEIRQLTLEEKTKLLQHELSFIREKIVKAGLDNVIMIQIPRALYDLFNMYFLFSNAQKETIPAFPYDCVNGIAKMIKHSALTRKYTDSVKDGIFKLNAFIANYIQQQYSMSYDKIVDELVAECWLFGKKNSDDAFKLLNRVDVEEAKNIVRQIVQFEKQDSQGNAILYRGAQNVVDSLIDTSECYDCNPPVCDRYTETPTMESCPLLSFRSLSFNVSIFTGCAFDDDACTMSYLSKFTSFKQNALNDKIRIKFKKFLLDDSSSENSLFFIPAIHPYIQLYSTGELFHARTKIGTDYLDKLAKFKSMNRRYSGTFVAGLFNCFPSESNFIEQCDYLKSTQTQEELNALYQRFKSTSVVSTWSSDAATQLKREELMKTRKETVENAALRGSKLPENLEFKVIGNQWKKFETIPSEIKFNTLEKYYPELRRRLRFMISDYISKYLYSNCPEASYITVSYLTKDSNYHGVGFPSATFGFRSVNDFQKCKTKFELLPDLEKGHFTTSIHPGNIERLFESSKFGFKETESEQKYKEILNMKDTVFYIGYFLSTYLLPQQRRVNDVEYKNQLNNYCMSLSEIFPQLKVEWQIGGKTRCSLRRNRRRKTQFKLKNKIESKPKNKTRTKLKNKTNKLAKK